MEWIDIEEEGNPKRGNRDCLIVHEDEYHIGAFNPKSGNWTFERNGVWHEVDLPVRFYFEILEPE